MNLENKDHQNFAQLVLTFKKIEVTHYFNPETGLNVFFNRDSNKFISGWLLKNDQLNNIISRRVL